MSTGHAGPLTFTACDWEKCSCDGLFAVRKSMAMKGGILVLSLRGEGKGVRGSADPSNDIASPLPGPTWPKGILPDAPGRVEAELATDIDGKAWIRIKRCKNFEMEVK